MTYPPQFDDNLLYPRVLDLDKIDVLVEDSESKYFNINGIPKSLGYGKHYFNISYNDLPKELYNLRNNSEILIEAKDANGTVIFTDVTPYKNISGEAIAYVWVKRDPLRTYKDIEDGQGTLTIVGELDNVPTDWVDKYNVRYTLPINIRKEISNKSPLLLQSASAMADKLILSETVEADMDNPNFNRSYLNISMSNLDTYGGKIDTVEVSYIESASILSSSEYTFLGSYDVSTTGSLGKKGTFENNIDEDYAQGLNPQTHFKQMIMPAIPHRTGSTFGGAKNQIKFQFKFKNSAGEYATAVDDTGSAPLIITSSYINFDGPATVIQGDNNLIDGQVYIGNAIGTGIEVNASSSAYLRSIGYLGFTSASAGSGSAGFVIYTGSILGANTDEYSSGGVGLELVQDANNYLRFNTQQSELDIHTEKFFIGGTNQFVSGAGGNIEISSSGFHLASNGNVIVSGTISASAGNIAGWAIGEDSLLASSMSINAASSSIFKVNSGSAVVPTPGDDQRFFVDFTPEDQTTSTKYYVRFGPNFGVTSDGTLIASGAQIEGVLIADDGTIGGFSILTQSLYAQPSTDAYIGMSTVGDTAFFASASTLQATASAPFNVKMDGTITASKALIDGTSVWSGTTIAKEKLQDVVGLLTVSKSIIDKTGSFENTTATQSGMFDSQSQLTITSSNLSASNQLKATHTDVTASILTATSSLSGSIATDNADIRFGTSASINLRALPADVTASILSVTSSLSSSFATDNADIRSGTSASIALRALPLDVSSSIFATTASLSSSFALENTDIRTGTSASIALRALPADITASIGAATSSLSGSIATDNADIRSGTSASIALRALPADITASILTATSSLSTSIATDNADIRTGTSASINARALPVDITSSISSFTQSLSSSLANDIAVATASIELRALPADVTASIVAATSSLSSSVVSTITTETADIRSGTSASIALRALPADITASINTATSSLSGSVSTTTTNITSDIANVRTEVTGTVNTATQSLSSSVSTTTTNITSDIGNVRTEVSGTVNAATQSLSSSVSTTTTNITSDIATVRTEVTGTVNTATQSLSSSVSTTITNETADIRSGTSASIALRALPADVTASINTATSSLSGSVVTRITSEVSDINTTIGNVRTEVTGTVNTATQSLSSSVSTTITNETADIRSGTSASISLRALPADVTASILTATSSLSTSLSTDIASATSSIADNRNIATSNKSDITTINDTTFPTLRTDITASINTATSSLSGSIATDLTSQKTSIDNKADHTDVTASINTASSSLSSSVVSRIVTETTDIRSGTSASIELRALPADITASINTATSSLSGSVSTTTTNITSDIANVRTEVTGTINTATSSLSSSVSTTTTNITSDISNVRTEVSGTVNAATSSLSSSVAADIAVATASIELRALPADITASINTATQSLSSSVVSRIVTETTDIRSGTSASIELRALPADVTASILTATSSLSTSIATDNADIRTGTSASIELRALPADVTASILTATSSLSGSLNTSINLRALPADITASINTATQSLSGSVVTTITNETTDIRTGTSASIELRALPADVTASILTATSSLSTSIATDNADIRTGTSASIELRALPADVSASIDTATGSLSESFSSSLSIVSGGLEGEIRNNATAISNRALPADVTQSILTFTSSLSGSLATDIAVATSSIALNNLAIQNRPVASEVSGAINVATGALSTSVATDIASATSSIQDTSQSFSSFETDYVTGSFQNLGTINVVEQFNTIKIRSNASSGDSMNLKNQALIIQSQSIVAATTVTDNYVSIGASQSIFSDELIITHSKKVTTPTIQQSMSLGKSQMAFHSANTESHPAITYDRSGIFVPGVDPGNGGTYLVSQSSDGAGGWNTKIQAKRVGDLSGTAYFENGKIFGTFKGVDESNLATSSYDSQDEGLMLFQTGSYNLVGHPSFPLTLQINDTTTDFDVNDGPGILFKIPTTTTGEADTTVQAGGIAVVKADTGDGVNKTAMNFYINTGSAGSASFYPDHISLQISQSNIKVKRDVIGFVSSFSDERLKENIKPICSSLDTITKLQGTTFNWNEKSNRVGEFNAGLIAQNVEEVIPHLVSEHSILGSDNKNYKSVKYQEMIPYLVEAIKEQQTEIQELKKQVKKLNRKSKRIR